MSSTDPQQSAVPPDPAEPYVCTKHWHFQTYADTREGGQGFRCCGQCDYTAVPESSLPEPTPAQRDELEKMFRPRATAATTRPVPHEAHFTVEAAYSRWPGKPDTLIGWRLVFPGKDSEDDVTNGYGILVWNDQANLAGFRMGNTFNPGVGEQIVYVPCSLALHPERAVIDYRGDRSSRPRVGTGAAGTAEGETKP
jgi:hypothetical protein